MFGKIIYRITGLDPAGPLFQGLPLQDGLNPSRASFVDVHHTNPGKFGTVKNLGVIDIWYNNINGKQPGCTASFSLLPKKIINDTGKLLNLEFKKN